MKRSKENVRFWNKKIIDLFQKAPKAQLTEHRWQAVRATLIETYPYIEKIDKKQFIQMLQDSDYIARKMRFLTEGIQVEIKKQLAQQYVVEQHFK